MDISFPIPSCDQYDRPMLVERWVGHVGRSLNNLYIWWCEIYEWMSLRTWFWCWVWVNAAWWISICISAHWQITISGNGDSWSCWCGIIVDCVWSAEVFTALVSTDILRSYWLKNFHCTFFIRSFLWNLPFNDLTYDCQNLAFLFGDSLKPIMARWFLNILAAFSCCFLVRYEKRHEKF